MTLGTQAIYINSVAAPTKDTNIMIRLDREEKRMLETLSAARGMKQAALLRYLLREYQAQEEAKKKETR